jgi:hypothetical protein
MNRASGKDLGFHHLGYEVELFDAVHHPVCQFPEIGQFDG